MRVMSGVAATLTPYELVFGVAEFENEHFPAIAAELEARGLAPSDPGAFAMLAAVGHMLRALRPLEDEGLTYEPAAILHYGSLAFQAWHFRANGKRLYVLTEGLLEGLIAHEPIGPWPFEAPAPAGYIQFPRNRVWTQVEGAGSAEPVDGFFWTMQPVSGGTTRLDAVLCTGMRPGRPGLGAIEVAAWLPTDPPGHWGDLQARETGVDFQNVLPGGELGRLYAVTNAAEVLKLVSRLFWYVTNVPGATGTPMAAAGGPPSPHALPPSTLAAIPLHSVER